MNGGGNYVSSYKIWPNAGTSEYLALLIELMYIRYMFGSNNAASADNQQERLFANRSNISANMAWYIVGFADGEGSFNISFKREASYGIGWKVALSFNISQRDESILQQIQLAFGCGTIRLRKDGVGYFEVRSVSELTKYIIPFFSLYPLKSKKRIDFEIFCAIAQLVTSKEHLTRSGMEKLLHLREPMNGGGKRKFSSQQILDLLRTESSETIRQIRPLKEVGEMI